MAILNVDIINNAAGTGAPSFPNGASITGAISGATQLDVDNLRLDGNTISSTDVNGNVVISPNGTGDIVLDLVTVSDLGAISGATQLDVDNIRVDGNTISSTDVNGNITLSPNGTGDIVLDLVTVSDLGAVSGATQLDVDNVRVNGNTISSTDAAGDLILTPDTTGDLVLDGANWPQADGTSGQVLRTDGAAQLSWTTPYTDPMTTNGDLVYRNASNITARLAVGSTGQVLTVTGGYPVWAAASSGGLSTGVRSTKTAAYPIVSGDNGYIIPVDTSGGAFTVTLPAPAAGFNVIIKDIGGYINANLLTVARNGSELIDGTANDDSIFINYGANSYSSDGTNWFRAASFDSGPVRFSRAVIAPGFIGSNTTNLEYLQLVTTGNSTAFGNLTTTFSRGSHGDVSSGTRGLFKMGAATSSALEYITYAVTGSGTSFGNLTSARNDLGAVSSETRGVYIAGYNNSVNVSTLDYVTIATTGNAVAFGDWSAAESTMGGLSSPTRGLSTRGAGAGFGLSQADYITIATTGNATFFGNYARLVLSLAGASSTTRGVFGGGASNIAAFSQMDYFTIATTGNSTTFGNLSALRSSPAGGASNKTSGLFIAGATDVAETIRLSSMDYITIATTSNSSNWGNLVQTAVRGEQASSNHGGIA